jgi:hypothetical protein
MTADSKPLNRYFPRACQRIGLREIPIPRDSSISIFYIDIIFLQQTVCKVGRAR